MKVEICSFSNRKIYPGKGKLYVRGDSKVFRFLGSKPESLFHQRKNPRKIAWTVLYRRMHKKGISEEAAKKRTRRTVKHQRGVVGASLDLINARRNQKPEVREAARKEHLTKSKETKKARAAERKANRAAAGANAQMSRQQAKGAVRGGPKA
ncbi:60S ribosomal protein L24 [Malassezia pachydermatis]|uniref:60s ribosomal protein l24 n=1 Tax=Malassezia pachydermatis TaxID=77020 RepID=A0A0M9VMV7_9BASI|nr:60s ribosomal protein l24 [Malassezia pachydermatis]KOS12689.1 60s ribosomal protein l24 [Malassezia pachydermatis]